MAAQTTPRDVQTLEPISHNYDKENEYVLAECTNCTHSSRRRLLQRDYDLEEDFKQSLVETDDDYVPCVIYRDCPDCGTDDTSHFVC